MKKTEDTRKRALSYKKKKTVRTYSYIRQLVQRVGGGFINRYHRRNPRRSHVGARILLHLHYFRHYRGFSPTLNNQLNCKIK